LATIWLDDTVVVTFKLRREILEELDELVKKGYFSSRSEAIRKAIIELLNHYSEEKKGTVKKVQLKATALR